MTEIRYMISDVSRILDIPANVLRYLEYHLSLNIKRTELGHRYYLQEDIDLLRSVKLLRDKGFHLKIIKSILPYIDKVKDLEPDKLNDLRDRLEAALGLSGIEAQERVKAQYGKVIDINMEEGEFLFKDPSTKQMTRLSSVKKPIEEVKVQPSAQEGNKISIVDAKSKNENTIEGKSKVIKKESDKIDQTIVGSEQGKPVSVIKTRDVSKAVQSAKSQADYQVTAGDKVKEMKRQKSQEWQPESARQSNCQPINSIQEQEKDKVNGEVAAAKVEVMRNDSRNPRVVEVVRKDITEKKSKSFKMEETPKNTQSQTGEYEESDTNASEDKSSSEDKQMLERKADSSILKESQEKIVQFREIMCAIVMDALKQNNSSLTSDINETVTQSIVKEMDYMMRVREERQEERFRQLDRTIRETQLQRQQAAATKEAKKKKPSKFFKKHNVRI